jgi:hypothetical protein
LDSLDFAISERWKIPAALPVKLYRAAIENMVAHAQRNNLP